MSKVTGYSSIPSGRGEAVKPAKEITRSGSLLPPEPISLKAERARKDDKTRASMRPEIAAMPIATENASLAAVLSSICDAYEASVTVPPYSGISSDELERRGLTEPVLDTMGRLGSKPSVAVLAAMKKAKEVPAKKDDRRGWSRPGSLMGLRDP